MANFLSKVLNPSSAIGGGGSTQAGIEAVKKRMNYKAPVADLSGAPQMPLFQSLRDESGLLQKRYQTTDQMNRESLEKLRGIGLGEGPSAWAQARGKELETQQQEALGQAAAAGQASRAQALGAMARRGGVSSGAQERMGQASAREQLMARQRAFMGGQKAREGLATEDERRRMQVLSAMPGMEEQSERMRRGAEEFNIQRALEDVGAERKAKIAEYQEQMRAWAAKKQADAIRAAGQQPSMLGEAAGIAGAMVPGGGGGLLGGMF